MISIPSPTGRRCPEGADEGNFDLVQKTNRTLPKFISGYTMLTEDLLSILACPVCKGELLLLDEGRYLLCRPCGVRFPVREGIPVLLADEASGKDSP